MLFFRYILVVPIALLSAPMLADEPIANATKDVPEQHTWDRVVIPAPFNPRPRIPEFLVASVNNGIAAILVPIEEEHEDELISPTHQYRKEKRSANIVVDGKSEQRHYEVEVAATFAHARRFLWKTQTDETSTEYFNEFKCFGLSGEPLDSQEVNHRLATPRPVALYWQHPDKPIPKMPKNLIELLNPNTILMVVKYSSKVTRENPESVRASDRFESDSSNSFNHEKHE